MISHIHKTANLIFCLFILNFSACAGDKCQDEKCTHDTEITTDYGMSRLLAVAPEDGEIIWGADFQGEFIIASELRDDNKQIIANLSDPCFKKDREFAFNVEKGSEVDVVPPVNEPQPLNPCSSFQNKETPELTYSEGVCIGPVKDSSAENSVYRAIDTANGKPLWEKEIIADSYIIDEKIFITGQYIKSTKEYRISRIGVTNGLVLWFHQQKGEMLFAGSDDKRVFLLDREIFALSKSTGDIEWRTTLKWDLKAPGFANGVFLDNTLFVTRNSLLISPCSDTK